MRRNIFAVVFGVVLAVILVMIVETIGHAIFPPPTDVDFSDPETLAAYMADAPVGALLFVLLAWATGAAGGGLLACFIAKSRPLVYAGAVAGVIALASIATMTEIPHPMWFRVAALPAIGAAWLLAVRVGARFGGGDNTGQSIPGA